MSIIAKMENVRIAFMELNEPKSVNDGAPRYSAVFILEPGSKNEKKIRSTMKDVAIAKWGDKGEKILKKLINDKRVCLGDGNQKTNKEGDTYDGFADMKFVNASSKTQPKTFDEDGMRVEPTESGIYAGCYVHGSVEIWAQDNAYGQRVNATLRAVKYSKDGQAFSGGTPVGDDEFDDITDGAGEDDFEDDDLV